MRRGTRFSLLFYTVSYKKLGGNLGTRLKVRQTQSYEVTVVSNLDGLPFLGSLGWAFILSSMFPYFCHSTNPHLVTF